MRYVRFLQVCSGGCDGGSTASVLCSLSICFIVMGLQMELRLMQPGLVVGDVARCKRIVSYHFKTLLSLSLSSCVLLPVAGEDFTHNTFSLLQYLLQLFLNDISYFHTELTHMVCLCVRMWTWFCKFIHTVCVKMWTWFIKFAHAPCVRMWMLLSNFPILCVSACGHG